MRVVPVIWRRKTPRSWHSNCPLMTHLLADLRYALRSLRRVPLFTAVAVLSIAFGIGANTAVFTLVDQVVLRKMAVVDPQAIVHITAAAGTEQYGGSIGDGT